MAAEASGAGLDARLEVLWWDDARGAVVQMELHEYQSGMTCRALWPYLPAHLGLALEQGRLQMSSHGRSLHPDEVLRPGDRLELLGPIALDVRAERAARVKAVRARSRNPYNRNHRDRS